MVRALIEIDSKKELKIFQSYEELNSYLSKLKNLVKVVIEKSLFY